MYKGAPFPFICDAPTQSRTASTLLSQSVLKKKKSRSSSRSHDAVCLFFLFNIFHYFLIRLKRVPTKGFICSSNITLSFGRYRANPTFCLTLSIPRKRGYFVEAVKTVIRLKTVPTNGFIRLSNIHRFVWSV